MPCCGNQRARLQGPNRTSGVAPLGNREQPGRVLYDRIFFEYLGETGMTAIGAVTGKRYRFNHAHAVLEVDPRDRPSLALVPKLRQRRA